MALPFYVVYAREKLGAAPETVGWFLFAQVLGGIVGNLVWARLVDRAGIKTMLTVCAVSSAAAPLLAVTLGPLGWQALLPTLFLAGAAFDGRQVGFQSALLTLAPATERPTFAALNAVLVLPVALLPLLAGLLLQSWPYAALFIPTAAVVALGALWTRRLKC
jgi:predicted MFS family arabinose efflux permease